MARRNSGLRPPRIFASIAGGGYAWEEHPMRRILVGAALIALAIAPAGLTSAAAAKPLVEVAFVLDTTGSMGPLIEGAKRKIWSIATSILETSPDAEVRMGLVAYRDIGDEYVTKKFDLTADMQDLYGNLLALQARGGGDWPESVNEALEAGVAKLAWTQGPEVTRIIFLVGDAPPHMDYAQDTKYPDVVRMARERGIVVNAVQAGAARDTERVWRTIAQMGHGEYIPIPQDGGHLVVIETPFDIEIIELQKRVNGTIIPYGPRAQRERVNMKRRQVSEAPAPAASDMVGYLARRASRPGYAPEAVTGEGDLVADVAAGRKKVAALKDDDLPDNVRKMNEAERQAFIDKQLAERKALNEKLAALVKQRDAYMAAERRKVPVKTGDSFDRAVESTLKAQIKK
jgi:hypothetical protein